MRILLIGATGYIGSAVAARLRESGHQVAGTARSESAAASLKNAGITPIPADATDAATLREAVTRDVDAVVMFAPDSPAAIAATETVLTALRGTDRTLISTSGVWVLGDTGEDTADESTPRKPITKVAWRPTVEDSVLAAAQDRVRGIVIRPGIVYGGSNGLPGMLVKWARAAGFGRYVGTPAAQWPTVHRADLASFYMAALEHAEPGTMLHAVDNPGVPVSAIAAAADVVAGGTGRAESWPVAEAAIEIGSPLAEALALHQRISGERSATQLGWRPHERDVITELLASAARPGSVTE